MNYAGSLFESTKLPPYPHITLPPYTGFGVAHPLLHWLRLNIFAVIITAYAPLELLYLVHGISDTVLYAKPVQKSMDYDDDSQVVRMLAALELEVGRRLLLE